MISESRSAVKSEVNDIKSAAKSQIDAATKEVLDIKSYVMAYIKNMHALFVKNIPNKQIVMLQKNNPRFFYFMACLCYIIIIALFASFYATGFEAAAKAKFLSLESSSGNCEEIGTQLDIELYATSDGAWEGFRRFKFQQAKYLFTFQGFDGSKFKTYIRNIFTNVIPKIGERAKTKPLYHNLVTWATFTDFYTSRVGKEESTTTFEFTGYSANMMNRDYYDAVFANQNGICRPTATRYEMHRSTFNMGWDLNVTFPENQSPMKAVVEFINPDCDSILMPTNFGFQPGYGDELNMEMDFLSFMSSISINLGIISTQNLEATGVKTGIQNVTGYFDPRYPDMAPIYCTYDVTAVEGEGTDDYLMDYYSESDDEGGNTNPLTKPLPPYCYIKIGNKYCLPALVPYNNTCLSCNESQKNIKDAKCGEQIDLTAVCIFAKDKDYNMYYNLPIMNQTTLYSHIQKASYSALNSVDDLKDDLAGFCPDCSLYVVNFYDNDDLTINGYYHQLKYAHCNDSFSISDTNWNKLLSSPPLPLTEVYFECTKSTSANAQDSFGIASSTAFTLAAPGILVMVTIIFMIVSYFGCGIELPKELKDQLSVSAMLKKEITDALAVEMKEFAEDMGVPIDDIPTISNPLQDFDVKDLGVPVDEISSISNQFEKDLKPQNNKKEPQKTKGTSSDGKWTEYFNEKQQKKYWKNSVTGESTWKDPNV